MPQCAITHSGSNSSAFRKHLTPSALLKAKHQFKPRSNQLCVSGEPVEMILEWLPRLKRSILSNSSIARTGNAAALVRETSSLRWFLTVELADPDLLPSDEWAWPIAL